MGGRVQVPSPGQGSKVSARPERLQELHQRDLVASRTNQKQRLNNCSILLHGSRNDHVTTQFDDASLLCVS
ncbi:hypothetical protein Y032_0423g1210 [Ancylostoma ceylanicum]|uniref:Uncharacterized protein n=1 Tax=Ancylostoma ceylanicum TaxID=53326 RepID=A0A016X0K5_9BILA|nr:hypothetical protein Y032_0423g1210 [Ancylostoma ceylanicum]